MPTDPAPPDAPVDEVEARRLAAKQPVSPAAGSYGMPWHALLVTIPIGAWVISFAFDLAAHGANEEFVYARAAFWLIGVGIVGAVAAAVTGILDLLSIARDTPAFRTGVQHLVLSDVALVAFVISFLLRRGSESLQAPSAGVLLLSVVALAALAGSAWLGLRLTYRYGVRVADEATQSKGFVRANEPDPNPDTIDDDAEVTA